MSHTDNIVIDLNFVPVWARRPADQNPYSNFKERFKGDRRRPPENRKSRSFHRTMAGSKGSPLDRGGRGTREMDDQGARPLRAPVGETESVRGKQKSHGQKPWPVLEVSFIPERRGLKPLARRLARTGRAYSLMDVASMFLSRPECYLVKVETTKADNGAPPVSLYQCTECKAVFLEREPTIAHGLMKHFSLFYEQEETRAEPPKGHFVCVARCGLSGVLLGPPNYHEYNDRVLELHRTRFASLTIEEYRKKIVNETDPVFIEQWKQEVCRQTIYRTRQESAPKVFKRYTEVEAHFREHMAPALVREGHRMIIPGSLSRQLEDPAVNQAIRNVWAKERRFPLKIAIALHPAFRRFGLYIFKTPEKVAFVTAIHPHPIDPSQTLDAIRSILEFLVQHPGSTRSELVKSILPRAAQESPEVAEIINQIRWLIEKGHVIEFFNGRLAVPYRQVPAEKRKEETKRLGRDNKNGPPETTITP